MDIEVSQSHPNPVPDSFHRKIELQSYADLLYLKENLAKSTRSRLDLHFPPTDSATAPAKIISLGSTSNISNSTPTQDESEEEDPLRASVRLLMDEWLQKTWSSAEVNLSVNGNDIPAERSAAQMPNCTHPIVTTEDAQSSAQTLVAEQEGVHFTYASFDSKLQRKVASLYGELESLTAQVSKLRRTAPQQGAQTYQEELRKAMEIDEAEWASLADQNAVKRDNILQLEPMREGWNEDVKEVYERGIKELATLSGVAYHQPTNAQPSSAGTSLTETVGKAQRARNVAMEFE